MSVSVWDMSISIWDMSISDWDMSNVDVYSSLGMFWIGIFLYKYFRVDKRRIGKGRVDNKFRCRNRMDNRMDMSQTEMDMSQTDKCKEEKAK